MRYSFVRKREIGVPSARFSRRARFTILPCKGDIYTRWLRVIEELGFFERLGLQLFYGLSYSLYLYLACNFIYYTEKRGILT